MIRSKKILKAFAVFFILEILSGVILPSMSFALTSGPTSPEHSTFEPVDVTDMVNVSTGDFVYNLPLFEVPGPSGGFPISMSYHGGIQPELDASWVGLGWSLNTGAINRSVDGTPDDFSGTSVAERSFWEGGSTLGLSTGVSFGNGAVSAGLTYSSDTYRGMSVGTNLAYGAGPSQASIGLNYSVDAYGKGKVSTSSNVKSVYQSQFERIKSTYDQVSGVSSIKSAVKTASAALPVSFHSTSGKEGGIRTKGFDFNLNIPVQGLSLQLGAKYKRYWMDEKVNSNAYGSIYFPSTHPDFTAITGNTYDINDLYYLDQVLIPPQNLLTKTELSKNPSKGFAGTFPTYDSYMVTGQGIGGTIRPYHLKANLYRATERSAQNQVVVQSYPLGGNIKPYFRFVNDFSNSFLYAEDDFAVNVNDPNPLTYQFKDEKITTGDGSAIDGYVDGGLAGSRNVEYFTKSEILNGLAPKLRKSNALGYSNTGGATIGGFMVTNESGVNYHYALPVYSYDEYSYSGSKDFKNKHALNLYKRRDRYAYTWLLTAMTGPDYVDVNGDGIANEGDHGYWITFEYGQWAPGYNWRNPAQNFNKDVDQQKDFFSKGKKEIYYLNAIRSATHTALFIKELRRDGKGVVHQIEPAAVIDGTNVEKIDMGGFAPVDYAANDRRYPTSALRLKEVLLIKNADLQYTVSGLAGRSATYNHSLFSRTYHFGSNVIDVHDISDIRGSLLQNSVRSVEFDHDYSLAANTPSSFISLIDNLNNASSHLSGSATGKLTLKAVKTAGKQGISSLPPIKFGYDSDTEKIATNAVVTYAGNSSDPVEKRISTFQFTLDQAYTRFDPGDIVTLYGQDDITHYAALLSTTPSEGKATFHMLSSIALPVGYIINGISKTKNPPYVQNYHDIWGFFKSDYVDFGHENISRMVSDISAKSTDAWSLRKIRTVTGADVQIEYESDTYNNSLKRISTVLIKDVEIVDQASAKLKVSLYGNNARNIFKPGNQVKIHGLLRRELLGGVNGVQKCDCNGTVNTVYIWEPHHSAAQEITEVGDNYVVVHDSGLNYYLSLADGGYWIDCGTLKDTHTPGERYAADEPYKFIGGDVEFGTNASTFSLGGGLRVKEISVKNDLLNSKHSTIYEYKLGVTPYEPLGLDLNIARLPVNAIGSCLRNNETEAHEEYFNTFVLKVAYRNMAHLFANARLMPGPGVMYGKVDVREATTQTDGVVYPHPSYNSYSFEVFNPKLIDVYNKTLTSNAPQSDNGYKLYTATPEGIGRGTPVAPIQALPVDRIMTSTASVQDFSAVIGTLKSVTTYDLENRKISETSYKYLFDEISTFEFPAYRAKLGGYHYQGLIEEVFADAKLVRNDHNSNYTLIGLLSKFSQFPSIQVSSTSKNFRTGVSQTSENLAYDYFSGQAVKTLSSDGKGNYFSTEVIPAYRKYPALSLPMAQGKNMLIQQAGQTTYKAHLNETGQPVYDGLVSATAETWSDAITVVNGGPFAMTQPGIWRRLGTFAFIGNDNIPLQPDGTYPIAHFSQFDTWNSSAVTSGWQRKSAVNLYDVQSHELEGIDINGDFSSTKMSSDASQVFATVANARYEESAFSGAEDAVIGGYYGGRVAKLNGEERFSATIDDATTTHTGQKALRLSNFGDKAFHFSLSARAGKTYHASVWVNASSGRLYYKLNGVTTSSPALPSESKKAGAWYLLEINIPIGSQNAPLEVWCETAGGVCHFDDFRVHPLQASMVSYVYNKWGEVSHILGAHNLYEEYRYDAMGRLVSTFKESFVHGRKQMNETIYHHANHQ